MSEHTFDPNVIALLDEIARSSESSLLRVPKEKLARWVPGPEDVLSPRGSFLTKAERHLVWAYREEAAAVLYEACIARLAEAPEKGAFVERARRPEWRQVATRARALQESRPELMCSLDGIGTKSASALCAAAVVLAPTDKARLALAASYKAEGQKRAAFNVYKMILSGPCSARSRAQALDGHGCIQCQKKEFKKSLESYLSAAEYGCRPDNVACVLIVACQLGDESRVTRSGAELGDAQPTGLWIDDLVAFLQTTRAAEFWAPTPSAMATIPRAIDKLPTAARRICETMQS
jgi:hypothetical protein